MYNTFEVKFKLVNNDYLGFIFCFYAFSRYCIVGERIKKFVLYYFNQVNAVSLYILGGMLIHWFSQDLTSEKS